ncbi:Lrp/AsnC family transcriptional regulator [Nonomuraea typhae]|uniref:Lrp/AsnC family transcriptional regulator n=1 Tax=Nonomuraea typhae TaxID=2603600 RepID=UPI001FE5529A|nr:Lrp/AsnC family transcriptional regulator [Nonomuraea typhae]
MDDIDNRLLDLLQHDAGRTLFELGELVGLSPSAVQRRIARYRADGVIAREVAVLDPRRLGAVVLATVLVTLLHETVGQHAAFAEKMHRTPQVQQCYSVAGPYDYVVILSAASVHECGLLGNRLFKDDDNVKRYETLMVFDTVKAGLAIPLGEARHQG